MRLAFQRHPVDIYGAVASCIILSALAYLSEPSAKADLIAIGFVCGYLSVGIVYPGRTGVYWGERLAWSAGVGAIETALFAVAVVGGLTKISGQLVITVFLVSSLLLGGGAFQRRIRLPIQNRLSWQANPRQSTSKAQTPHSLASRTLIAGLFLLLVVSVAYLEATRSSARFTEFYLFGLGSGVSRLPSRLNISETDALGLGILNHETTRTNYTVRVDLVGVRVVFNASARANETVEVNRTARSYFNVSLLDGQNWTNVYSFQIDEAGFWEIQFLLFKDAEFSSAYRETHLFVLVS